jgi:hypothetical protein
MGHRLVGCSMIVSYSRHASFRCKTPTQNSQWAGAVCLKEPVHRSDLAGLSIGRSRTPDGTAYKRFFPDLHPLTHPEINMLHFASESLQYVSIAIEQHLALAVSMSKCCRTCGGSSSLTFGPYTCIGGWTP